MAVDETEYSIGLSRTLVGAGEVTFNVYNRGMDDHDLAVVDANGNVQVVAVPPRETRSLVVQLGVGQTRVYCSLFAGTPASHEALGMSAALDVGEAPCVPGRQVAARSAPITVHVEPQASVALARRRHRDVTSAPAAVGRHALRRLPRSSCATRT